MPIYAYHCPQCQDEFELLVRASTQIACPQCGATELTKLLSLTAPQGKSKAIIAQGRAAAAKEGHFSNYSAADRRKAG
jgi:putative FmdB family regulatory protein